MKLRLSLAILLLACCLAVCCLLAGCESEQPAGFSGYVEGEFVYVAAPLGGRLVDLPVVRGQKVEPGELLFGLERERERAAVDEAQARLRAAQDTLADREKGDRPSELAAKRAQLEEAKARLELQGIELRRRKALYAAETIAKEELDQVATAHREAVQTVNRLEADLTTAELGSRSDQIRAAAADVAAAKAALGQADWNLGQKEQHAIQASEVFELLHFAGDWVSAGQPVLQLLPPGNVELRFYVPETMLGSLTVGQPVWATWDGAPAPAAAHISFISPQAEYTPPVIFSSTRREALVFLVRARPADESLSLHPGQPVDVYLSQEEARARDAG